MVPYQVLSLEARVDLGVMAIKTYSTLPKVPALQKPGTLVSGGLTFLQRCRRFILQSQPNGPFSCRDQCPLLLVPGYVAGIRFRQVHMKEAFDHLHFLYPKISKCLLLMIIHKQKSKVGDLSRRWPVGTLFQ